MAHVGDPEDLPAEVGLPAGDADVALGDRIEEVRRVVAVDGIREGDSRDRVREISRAVGVGEQFQSHRLEPLAERGGLPLVPADARRHRLGDDVLDGDRERPEEGHGARKRRLVAFLFPEVPVEVLVEGRGLAVEPLLDALADPQRADPRGCRQRLLRVRDGDVDVPLVHEELVAADAGDAVDDERRVVLAGDLADLRARVEEARRGLVVDQRDDVRVVGDRVFDVRNREGLPPVGLDSSTRGVAVGDPGEPAAELPVDQRDDLTVLVNEVGDGRFHPHRRRAVENQRRAALGGGRLAGERRVLEDVVESVLCALVHRLELRGSVRHHRLRHRLEHLVGHRHGTGVEEQEVLGHSWEFRGARDKRRETPVGGWGDGRRETIRWEKVRTVPRARSSAAVLARSGAQSIRSRWDNFEAACYSWPSNPAYRAVPNS